MQASNGWLHGISRLLIPPPLFEAASIFSISAVDPSAVQSDKDFDQFLDQPILLDDPTLGELDFGRDSGVLDAEIVLEGDLEAAVAEAAQAVSRKG